MKRIIATALFLTVSAISFMSCSQNPYKDFQATNTGLLYKFHIKNDAPKPNPTDIIFAKMRYAINDSILFNDSVLFMLVESRFPGDFYEGIAMMGKGDSATFITKADLTMKKIFQYQKLPSNVTSETMMQFDFMIQDIMTNEAYKATLEEAKNKQVAEMEAALAAYIKENNINTKPTKSGLYFIEQENGKGRKPKEGDDVYVHYKGWLLDGTVFDSSYDRGNQPIDFTLGHGQVISGWEEGIAMLRKGGKAQLIIPFYLAYGERSAGSIPPYSSLIFDVELVDIK